MTWIFLRERLLRSAVLLALCSFIFPSLAAAGGNSEAVVVLYGSTADFVFCGDAVRTPCSTWSSQLTVMASYNMYIVVARGDSGAGISEVSLGSSTDSNLFLGDWSLCADLDSPSENWPGNGGGNRLIWTTCRREVLGSDGVHAIGGFSYVYAYAETYYELTANHAVTPSEFEVVDCSGSVTELETGGRLAFGSDPGFNPCQDEVPVKKTTWGGVKRLYHQ